MCVACKPEWKGPTNLHQLVPAQMIMIELNWILIRRNQAHLDKLKTDSRRDHGGSAV